MPRFMLDIKSLEENLSSGSDWAKTNGARVQARREALDLSRSHVSRVIGKSVQTIHGVETGRIVPRDYLKLAIAHALGCPAEDLFPLPTRERAAEFMDVEAA